MMNGKSTPQTVVIAHAAVSCVLIIVAASLYAVGTLDLTTTLGLVGIAVTLVGGNAAAILAGGKYAERKTAAGARIVAEHAETQPMAATHTVTVESRTTIAPEPAGEPDPNPPAGAGETTPAPAEPAGEPPPGPPAGAAPEPPDGPGAGP